MKFNNITLQNYASFHGTHEFKLSDRGLTLILGDNQDDLRTSSNGSGKSTLLDSLDWVLWGDIPRGDHVDSIINEEAGKDTRVTVNLSDDDGTPITITRTRKAPEGIPKLSLVIGDKDLTALDTGQTQAHIERVLGMDREVFHATVLFGQLDLWSFADATDKQRIDLLTKILQLGQIDEWLDKTKAIRKKNQDVIQELGTKEANLEGQIASLEGIDYDAHIKAWDASRHSDISKLTGELKNLPPIPDVKKIRAEIDILTIKADPPETIPELDEVKATLASHYTALRYAMDSAKAFTIEVTQARTKQAGTCGECGQEITADHLAKEIARLTVKAQDSINEAATIKAKIAESEAVKERLTTQNDDLQRKYRDYLSEVDLNVSRKHSELAEAIRLENNHAYLLKEISRLEVEANPHVTAKSETKGKIKKLRQDKLILLAEITVINEDNKYLDFWVEGFGPKGLKSYILDSRLQEMTDAANEWVKMLTGGTIWLRFETQAKGRSTGKLSNKISIRVFRFNPNGSVSERNYKSWSGGEKQRVSLGIDFGLSKLVAARASKRYSLLVLDEVFKHLDGEGREAVVEMLQKLSHEKESVIVVDHSTDLQGAFENTVVVRKENGRSQIMEGKNGENIKNEPATKIRRGKGNLSSRSSSKRRAETLAG